MNQEQWIVDNWLLWVIIGMIVILYITNRLKGRKAKKLQQKELVKQEKWVGQDTPRVQQNIPINPPFYMDFGLQGQDTKQALDTIKRKINKLQSEFVTDKEEIEEEIRKIEETKMEINELSTNIQLLARDLAYKEQTVRLAHQGISQAIRPRG